MSHTWRISALQPLAVMAGAGSLAFHHGNWKLGRSASLPVVNDILEKQNAPGYYYYSTLEFSPQARIMGHLYSTDFRGFFFRGFFYK